MRSCRRVAAASRRLTTYRHTHIYFGGLIDVFSPLRDHQLHRHSEFISRHAKAKLKKLQRGSVKGFIADNKQIKSPGVFDSTRQEEIEKILQIRHLYAHQNGIIDERFREYFPAAKLNDEYQMTLDEFLKRFEYLTQAIDAVDRAAQNDYQLAPFTWSGGRSAVSGSPPRSSSCACTVRHAALHRNAFASLVALPRSPNQSFGIPTVAHVA